MPQSTEATEAISKRSGPASDGAPAPTSMTEPDVQPIVDWLIEGSRPATDPAHWLGLVCRRMLARGLRLHRVAVFVRPLHPNVAARAYYWRHDSEAVERDDGDHDFMATEEARTSPIRAVQVTRHEIRRRLSQPDTPIDFPVLEELRAAGVTDYLITPLEFLNGEVHAMSFASRSAGGFSDGEIAALQRLKPALTRMVEIFGLARKAGNILDAYLGRQAGAKVLQGQIRRGDVEKIQAAIWFCDLRGSTALADAMEPREFLALLNDYFERVLGPVLERDGQVLHFIGDGALAIFPVEDHAAGAATRALDAATDSIARMDELNKRREQAGSVRLGFGIGLHLGDMLYGNMGTSTRIAFSVVGAAVNEAARIEGLCKRLGAQLLVSERFARQTGRDWRSLGRHELAGVGETMELFTLG
jgi:adenylate cyclase